MEMRQQIARALIIAVVVIVCGLASMYEVSSEFRGNAFADEPVVAEGADGLKNDGDPENPTDPDNPGDPANPDDPDNPQDPDNPDDPDNPQDPDDPVDPGNPDDPQNPDDPVDPVNPDDPQNPDNPDDPQDPDTPDDPTDPDDPDVPPGTDDPDDPEETEIEKVMRLIEALPSDPDKIIESDRDAIDKAQAAYDALSPSDQALLDTTKSKTDQSYGRLLEAAQWGLLAHSPIDNSTSIADGDYSAYVTSLSDMGKSTSQRNRKWIAVKLTVKNGETWALLQCETESPRRTMCVGGKSYTANVVNGIPEFEVPIVLNDTTTVTIKTNDISDSLAVQIVVSLPLDAASASDVADAKKKAQEAAKTASSKYIAADAKAVKQTADALETIASKDGVTAVEIAVATKALDDTIANAKLIPDESESSASSSSGSASSSSADGSGSSSKGSKGSKGSKSSASSSSSNAAKSGVSGNGRSQVVPNISRRTQQIKSGSSTSSRSSAGTGGSSAAASKSKGSASVPKSTEELGVEAAAGAQADQVTSVPIDKSADKNSPEFWMKVVTAGGVLALLLLGMCTRTFLFVRAKEVE